MWICAGVYAAVAAFALLVVASLHCGPCIEALGEAAGLVGNGLAGGTLAGLIAIGVYLGGQRSRSRSQKFMLARTLLVELDAILVALSDPGIDRHTARPGYRYTMAGGPHRRYDLDRAAPAPERFVPSSARRVYEGMVISGGMSRFGELLQRRLHKFYGHMEQGAHDDAARMAGPLGLEIHRFRNRNAPLERAAVVRLLLAVPTLGGRIRLPRRIERRRTAATRPGAGSDSAGRPSTILGPPRE